MLSLVLVLAICQAPNAPAAPAAAAHSADPTSEVTVAAARRAAHASGKPVEVTAFRGETREVYAESNGSFTSVEHLRPVRTRQGDRWVAIDTRLRTRPDGSVAPVASSVDLSFSGGGTAPMARLDRAGRGLSLSWPASLPKPRLDGDTATYPDVLPGVDLRLRAEADGMSQLIVVRTPQAAKDPRLANLRLGLTTRRLTVAPWSGGGLQAADTATGRAVFAAPRPLMWDSTRPMRSATAADPADGPLDGAKVAGIKTSVAARQLTLVPDQRLLTGAGVTFPVYIDPAWRTEKDTSGGAWAMVSSGFPTTSYYKFSGKSTEGVGFCDVSLDGNCVKDQVKRLFYRIPASYFAGKTILSATFTGNETSAYDCNTDTNVQLWLTKAFGSSSTWNSTSGNWLQHLDSRAVSYCSSTPVEFDATAAAKQAASSGWSTITFGLRAYSETSMTWWKRFADDASLRVNYNSPPPQPKMTQLTMSPGGPCVSSPQPYVNEAPSIYATNLTDPDGDKVYAEFQASWDDGTGWGPKWTSAKIGPKASGTNVFSVQVPSSIPQNTTIEWHVRTYDGAAYSPWSYSGSATGCYFTYDATAPDGPAITSADGRYPRADPSDENAPWNDGVGRHGVFTLDSSATDVVKYQYTVNGGPARTITTTNGGPATINVLPADSGLILLAAQAVDAAGHVSETETYYFRARAGDPARADWSLDETSGTQVTGKPGDLAADLRGGATLGADGAVGTAMTLDGTGYAMTGGPVVDTTKSFAVSAWVKLTSTADFATAVSQDGTWKSGFWLQYSKVNDRWAFARHTVDGDSADGARVLSTDSPQVGTWTHLLGVYDASTEQLKLYVNGEIQGTTSFTGAWSAKGRLAIGRALWNGQPADVFPGAVDEVKTYDQVLSDDDARTLFQQNSVSGKTPTASWSFDETSGDQAIGHASDQVADVHGGVTLGADGMDGKAMTLDGTGYAATDRPLLNTTNSFSVSAWVKLTRKTAAPVIVSQEGAVGSSFALYYWSGSDQWAFNMQTPDDDAHWVAPTAFSKDPPTLNQWTHLVGTYDAVNQTINLYVNGVLQQTVAQPYTFVSTGPLNIGRFKAGGTHDPGYYFNGSIDDLKVFDRVVSGSEITDLFDQHPVVVGRWKLNTDGADDTVAGHSLSLAGDAHVDPAAGILGDPMGGLVLDGAGDCAVTSGPVVPTDQSFTIAGWVQTATAPAADAAFFSQEGDVGSGFTVRYSPTAVSATQGGYQIEMPAADTAGATLQQAGHSAFHSLLDWDHVAIVYDAFQDKMTLYVNGAVEAVADTGQVSYRFNTRGFNATKGFHLGCTKSAGLLGEYWPGVIDDVWAFSGVLGDEQIQTLAGYGEELPTTSSP